MLIQSFSIDQAAGAAALIRGSVGGLLVIVWRSRCKRINCSANLMQCEREVAGESETEEGAEAVAEEIEQP